MSNYFVSFFDARINANCRRGGVEDEAWTLNSGVEE